MVEVFKTNVEQQQDAAMLLSVLSQGFPLHKINFDLDDCDNILRVEGANIMPDRIIGVLISNGYQCSILE